MVVICLEALQWSWQLPRIGTLGRSDGKATLKLGGGVGKYCGKYEAGGQGCDQGNIVLDMLHGEWMQMSPVIVGSMHGPAEDISTSVARDLKCSRRREAPRRGCPCWPCRPLLSLLALLCTDWIQVEDETRAFFQKATASNEGGRCPACAMAGMKGMAIDRDIL